MPNEVFLTFDIDWASDPVLNATIDMLEELDVGGTFLATHKTPSLEKIRYNEQMELGIHPNFNNVLMGHESKSYHQIIDEFLEIAPDATCERAHALTQNSLISFELKRRGLIYDLNTYIPLSSNILFQPYYAPSGLLTVPFFFEDDIYFFYEPSRLPLEEYFAFDGIKVFNFHPIHVFLNTDSRALYEQAKTISDDPMKLKELKNTKFYGVADFLMDVIDFGKKRLFKFKTIKQIAR